MENNVNTLREMIQQNETATIGTCTFCRRERCRDCSFLELDNDHWNDGTRRCAYKGRWVYPSDEACGNFKP